MKMMDRVKNRARVTSVILGGALVYFLIAMTALFWFDWLWMLGVEESQRYTWWGVIYGIANGGW